MTKEMSKLSFKNYGEADSYFRDKAHESGSCPIAKFGEGDANKYRRFVLSFIEDEYGNNPE